MLLGTPWTSDRSGCLICLIWVPYDKITCAVSSCPQSWLTTMGNSSAEGRCLNNKSRQRFTVGLLHAMTKITATTSFVVFKFVVTTTFTDCFSSTIDFLFEIESPVSPWPSKLEVRSFSLFSSALEVNLSTDSFWEIEADFDGLFRSCLTTFPIPFNFPSATLSKYLSEISISRGSSYMKEAECLFTKRYRRMILPTTNTHMARRINHPFLVMKTILIFSNFQNLNSWHGVHIQQSTSATSSPVDISSSWK